MGATEKTMSDKTNTTQLAVIGGGPGGYAAAFLAADLGMKVTLIDPEPNPGGVCLYRGCIPSKALLHAARVLTEAREAANWGIEFPAPKIDINKLRAWKDGVVKKLTGGLGQLSKQRAVTYVRGEAAFLSPQTLAIRSSQGSQQQVAFDHAILATGSRPASIPGVPAGSPRVMDSTSALEIADVPKTLLVVGGGYIGLELGTVYAALGTAVSVVEMMPGLLPGVDRDLVSPLSKRMEKIFRSIMLSAKVAEMKEEKNGVRVKFEGAAAPAEAQLFDKVLVSVGRKPNSGVPGLDKTKVQVDARGPWGASGRAMTLDRTEGVTKLIIDPESERVLGVGLVGIGAGELIAEGVLAVEMAALASDIKLSIHPHPTLSETIMEAAEVFFGQSTHVYRPVKK